MNTHIIWIIDHKTNSLVPHTHDFYQLIYCKKKGGTISIGENTYQAKQDYIYFIPPGTLHSVQQNGDLTLSEFKFVVQDEEANKLLSNAPFEFQLSDIQFMKMIIQFIVKEGIESKIYCDETTRSALNLLLAKIIHQFNENSSSQPHDYQVFYRLPEKTKNNTDVLILDLEHYMEQNAGSDITLEELAKRVNLNKNYFVKRFKILFGESPMKFMASLRIKKAKQLILDGNMSIQQIADTLGYNSIHHFSAAFKQSQGMSPREYCKYFNSAE